MKRLTITGIIVLLLGIPVYLFLIDEISGISRALIIGLTIGSVMALREQLRES